MPRCSDCNQRVREHGDRCTVCTRHATAEDAARVARRENMDDWQEAQRLIDVIHGCYQCGEEMSNGDIKDALMLLLKDLAARKRASVQPKF